MNYLPTLPSIFFLQSHRSTLTESLTQRLRKTGLWNVFNPSIASSSEGIAITFRAGRWSGDKPFRAYYLPPTKNARVVDLTDAYTSNEISIISDPKLVTLGDELWVTFNTGHFENPNRIFIAQVHPNMSPPYELIVRERSATEKNWVFFRRNGVLHAVYSISPLVILRAVGRLSAGKITLEPAQDSVNYSPSAHTNLTLGTQLAVLNSDNKELGVIVHRKFYWGRRRAYLGLPACLRCDAYPYSVTIGHNYLAHSPKALIGERVRHNPNLLSCTYFSGLVVRSGRALLGYGINDVAAGFAEIAVEALGFDVSMRR